MAYGLYMIYVPMVPLFIGGVLLLNAAIYQIPQAKGRGK